MALKPLNLLNRFWEDKVFRFLVCGVITAAFNVLLLALMIKVFAIHTSLLRNLANVLSIEISLLFSFFVYRSWVWPVNRLPLRDMLTRQIPLYHLSITASLASRSFIVFPILDWLGVNYMVNTLIGILFGSIINYKVSDKWVFSPGASLSTKSRKKHNSN